MKHILHFVTLLFALASLILVTGHASAQEPLASPDLPTVTILSPNQAATLAAAGGAQAAEAVPEGPRWTLFADAEKKVAGSTIKVDPLDGIHIAYYDSVALVDHPKAIYLYCPASAACEQGVGWIGAEIGTDVTNVELAVTSTGKPRLLIERWGSVYGEGEGDDYYYAECNSGCDTVSSWQIGYVTSRIGTELSDVYNVGLPRRGFALDHADHPGFVYFDKNYIHAEPDHIGGFYAWCESDCAAGTKDAPTWHDVLIGGDTDLDYDIYSLPALQYTSNNQPRIVVNVTTNEAGEEREGIVYKSCDSACNLSASWQHTIIAQRGNGTNITWDLAIDSANRPHVALYQGVFEDGSGKQLLYLTCSSSCANAANWKTLNLGLAQGEGETPDIELQPNGKPAITFLHNGGLGVELMRCTGDCSKAAGWKETILDTSTDLEQDFPIARPLTCDAGFWDADSTRLAFAADGRMRVTYDAAYQARCLFDDPTDPSDTPYYHYEEIFRAVRVLIWEPDKPGGDDGGDGGGNNGSVPLTYLPFVGR